MKSFLDRFRRKATDGKSAAPKKPGTPNEIAEEAIQAGYSPTLKRRRKDADSDSDTIMPTASKPAAAPPASGGLDEVVTFELGDFLGRIPEPLLATGPHDVKQPVKFDVGDLSARIARGQTTLPLAEIYKRIPSIFRGEIRESDNIEIRFPWQKLLQLVKAASASSADAGLSESAAEALAYRLR